MKHAKLPPPPVTHTIASAGLVQGKFTLQLDDGSYIGGVTHIASGKPRYEDGTELIITLFVPNKTKPK